MSAEAWDDDFDLGDSGGLAGMSPLGLSLDRKQDVPEMNESHLTLMGVDSMGIDLVSSGSDTDDGFDFEDPSLPLSLPLSPEPPTTKNMSLPLVQPAPLPTGKPGEALVGISADPSTREAWDDDFDLGMDDEDDAATNDFDAIPSSIDDTIAGTTLSLNTPSTIDLDGFGESDDGDEDWDAEMGLDDDDVLTLATPTTTNDTRDNGAVGGGEEDLVVSSSSSSDEEDWDEDFKTSDDDFTQNLGMIRNLIQGIQTVGMEAEVGVPKRYRLLDTVSLSATHLEIKYPPPSETYSVHPSDGFKRMSGKQINDWLTGIAAKKLKTYITGGRFKR